MTLGPGRAALLGLGIVLVTGCKKPRPDPVLPEPSGGLVPAPPGALGARAAILAGDAGVRRFVLPEAPPAPATPGPPSLAPPPAGSGVAL